MKTIILFMLMVIPIIGLSETGYRTVSNGDWSSSTTWEAVELDINNNPIGMGSPVPNDFYPCVSDGITTENSSIIIIKHNIFIRGLVLACSRVKLKYDVNATSGNAAKLTMVKNDQTQEAPYLQIISGAADGPNDNPVIFDSNGIYGGNDASFIIEGYPPGSIPQGAVQPKVLVFSGRLEVVRSDAEIMGQMVIGDLGRVIFQRDLQLLGDSAVLHVNGLCSLKIGDDLHAFCLATIIGSGGVNTIRTNQNPGYDGSPQYGTNLQANDFQIPLLPIANGVTQFLPPGESGDGLFQNINFSTDACGPELDLQVTKSVDISSVAPGDIVNYKIEVKNNGLDTAEQVKIEDILDSRLEFISSNSPLAYLNGVWSAGLLYDQQVKTLEIRARVKKLNCGDSIENTVSLIEYNIDGDNFTTDYNPSNNEANSVVERPSTTPILNSYIQVQALSLTKSKVTFTVTNGTEQVFNNLKAIVTPAPLYNTNPVSVFFSLGAYSSYSTSLIVEKSVVDSNYTVPATIEILSKPSLCQESKKSFNLKFGKKSKLPRVNPIPRAPTRPRTHPVPRTPRKPRTRPAPRTPRKPRTRPAPRNPRKPRTRPTPRTPRSPRGGRG